MIKVKKNVVALALSAAMAFSAHSADVFLNTPEGFNVLSMSPNGKWAVGVYVDAGMQEFGFRWNLESGSIEMLDENPCTGWDVANDGTVSGDYMDSNYAENGAYVLLPGFWRDGQWQQLEMPSNSVTDAMGYGISPDGHYMTGSVRFDGVYRAYIWKDGKIYRDLGCDKHTIGFAVAPDGSSAIGYTQLKNRAVTYWRPDGTAEYLLDSPDYSYSPWNYGRQYSPDGSKFLYWGGWLLEGEDTLWLYCVYDVKTGERQKVLAPSYDSDMEFFDISNSGTLVGSNGGRGYIYENGKAMYIDDYIAAKGVDMSGFKDFYNGEEAYVGQLPIVRILAISEDEKTLAGVYYNTEGQIASIIIKRDQDLSASVPAEVKVAQLSGLNTAAVTWKTPVGTSGLRYNIYRNGQKLNALPLTQEYYYDNSLAEGEYTYEVSNIIDGKENKAEAVKITIQNPKLEAPLDIFARQKGINSALVEWKTPFSNLTHKRYFDPENHNLQAFSVYEPLNVETAIRYTKAELDCYKDYEIAEVTFVPMAQQDSWTINIYSRSLDKLTLIATQPVFGDVKIGALNTVELMTPVALPGTDIVVAVQTQTKEGAYQVIGADMRRVVPGYSDLLRQTSQESFISAYESSVEAGYTVTTISWAIDLGLKNKNASAVETQLNNYLVYLNGEKAGTSTDPRYVINELEDGEYLLAVAADYANGSSDAVNTKVKIAAKYPQVQEVALERNASNMADVTATWKAPLDEDRTAISYSSATTHSMGIKGPASLSYALMAAAIYPADMTRGYDGYTIKSFDFYPLTDAIYTFYLYEDDEKIYELDVEDYEFRAWNHVNLPEKVTLKEGCTYQLVIDCFDPRPNTDILAIDNQTPRSSYSDLYSTDSGESWLSLTDETGSHGNWMLGMTVVDPNGKAIDVDGYDVVIDGKKVNASMVKENKYAYNFGTVDQDLHKIRIDTYYPARTLAETGNEVHFYLYTTGIEAVVGNTIQLQCGPNYLVVEGEGVQSITLIDAAGREVANAQGNKLDISDIHSGMYVASVRTDKGIVNRKLNIKH